MSTQTINKEHPQLWLTPLGLCTSSYRFERFPSKNLPFPKKTLVGFTSVVGMKDSVFGTILVLDRKRKLYL